MQIYLTSTPKRSNQDTISKLQGSRHILSIFPSVWPEYYSDSQKDEMLKNEIDVNSIKLQLNTKRIKDADWACALTHHRIYQKALNQVTNNLAWICVIEDDVILEPTFIQRLNELEKLTFNHPTIIQLFSRGKRFARHDISLNKLHRTLYKADLPPGQTALYMMNISALKLATKSQKATGNVDWPFWAKHCNFLISYPWVGLETSAGSLIQFDSKSRFEYYSWQIKILFGLHFFQWKRKGFSYSDYYFNLIKPFLLRLLLRAGLYKVLDKKDPNSIWLRRN